MSPVNAGKPSTSIRRFLRGLGEVGVFVGECALAVFEVWFGRWPQPVSARSRKAKPPTEGEGPVEKNAAYPTRE